VTVQDYYGLAGVFASAQLADRPLVDTERAAAVLAARQRIDALEAELNKIADNGVPAAQKLKSEIAALRRDTPEVDQPWAHVVFDASVYVLPDGEDKTRLEERPGEPRDLPVFRPGNPSSPGEIVPRRYVAVLSQGEPQPFRQGSGRLELADAILNDSQALAARVIVNRIWAQHFGRGLVRTTSDFGAQGERPTHPELLDELAARLIDVSAKLDQSGKRGPEGAPESGIKDGQQSIHSAFRIPHSAFG
jgi:hypothetical protein